MTQRRGHLHDGFAVYTQEEVRLVRATATLFDFDRLPGTSKLLISPSLHLERLVVPVFEGERKVGAASLFPHDRKIIGLLSFDYETPERFDLSINRPVYALPRGDYYLLDKGNTEEYTLDYVDISGVDLSYAAPKWEGRGSQLVLTKYTEIEG